MRKSSQQRELRYWEKVSPEIRYLKMLPVVLVLLLRVYVGLGLA